MVDWNKLAYNIGQMAGDGVNKANELIDAGERKVRQSLDERRRRQEQEEISQYSYHTRPDAQYINSTPDQQDARTSVNMEEMKDAQDRIRGWFGPNRVVRVDMADGSFAYYKIHDTQRSEDAVLIVSQMLQNRMSALQPRSDLINVQNPYEEDVRVLIIIDKTSLETGSPTYDDRTVSSQIIATIYSFHAEDSNVLGVETVPYDATDRQWPWDKSDRSKWTLQAAEYRPQ